MRRRIFHRFINRAIGANVSLGLTAYVLHYIDERFTWLLFAALVVLIWLGVAWIGSFLEFMIEGDSRRR